MKISGYFKTGQLEGAYVVARLLAKAFGLENDLEFIVDAGASKTIISDKDALSGRARKPTPFTGGMKASHWLLNTQMAFSVEDALGH